MSVSRRFALQRPVLLFGIAAYAISWTLWLPTLVGNAAEPSPVATLFVILGGFGPLLAAVLVAGLSEGRAGLRAWRDRVLRFRAPWTAYAFALLWPIGAAVLLWALRRPLGLAFPEGWQIPPLAAYPVAFLFVLLLGGGQEEPGWRGFALPRLLKQHSPLAASLLVGALWALWHLPLFVAPGTPQSEMPLLVYIPHVLVMSILFTWLYLIGRGSAWLAMVLHAGLNAVTSWIPVSGGGIAWMILLLAVEGLTAVIVVVAYGAERFTTPVPEETNA
jgi:uncharacterized protein